MALLVFTFVISLGAVFQAVDLVSRGASWRLIAIIFALGLPPALSFAIPVSSLVSTLLVFDRFSVDGEITALMASGCGLFSVAFRPVMVATGLAVLCFWLNSETAPRCLYVQRLAIDRLARRYPVEMIEAGRFISDIPGLVLYIGRKSGNELTDVRIYDRREEATREINARSGRLQLSADAQSLDMVLRGVRISDPARKMADLFCDEWHVRVPNTPREGGPTKRRSDFSLAELYKAIVDVDLQNPDMNERDKAQERMALRIELNKRGALAASCLAFVLVAIPVGIRTQRKETSIGIGLSLLVALVFYMFVLAAESLRKRPEFRPDLIVWIPIVLFSAIGLVLLSRANRPR